MSSNAHRALAEQLYALADEYVTATKEAKRSGQARDHATALAMIVDKILMLEQHEMQRINTGIEAPEIYPGARMTIEGKVRTITAVDFVSPERPNHIGVTFA